MSSSKNMLRHRPYNGKLHTLTGSRGSAEIKGITFRDLCDCFIRAVMLSTGAEVIDGVDTRPFYNEANKGELAQLDGNDLYLINLNKLDPIAICQNLACEVEKLMEIFPNIQKQGDKSDSTKDAIIENGKLEVVSIEALSPHNTINS